MSTEKKIAVATVLIGMLIPTLFLSCGTYQREFVGYISLIWQLLLFWGALLLGCGLYMTLRPAAVIGSALATIILYGLICFDTDPSDVNQWERIFYLLFCGIAFLGSIYPAVAKPKIFTRSWKSAFFASLGYSYLSIVLSILITKSA